MMGKRRKQVYGKWIEFSDDPAKCLCQGSGAYVIVSPFAGFIEMLDGHPPAPQFVTCPRHTLNPSLTEADRDMLAECGIG